MDYTNLMWVTSVALVYINSYHGSCNPVNYRYYLKLATVMYYMNLITLIALKKWGRGGGGAMAVPAPVSGAACE